MMLCLSHSLGKASHQSGNGVRTLGTVLRQCLINGSGRAPDKRIAAAHTYLFSTGTAPYPRFLCLGFNSSLLLLPLTRKLDLI